MKQFVHLTQKTGVSGGAGWGSLHIAGGASNELACGVARRPGPLEVEAAEMAGHIQYLADEIQTGLMFGLHRFGADVIGIHAAQGHLRRTVALSARWLEVPAIELQTDVA